MTPEWVVVGITVAGVVVSFGRFTATVNRLDSTLDKLADAVANETTTNAVQNNRLDNHETRIERLEER
jgi:hypothetical protein